MGLKYKNQLVLHRWIIRLFIWKLCREAGIKDYTISGSYRRGKWFCNDIDLVVPVKSDWQANGILTRFEQLGWTCTYRSSETSSIFTNQFRKKILDKYLILDIFLSYPGHMGNTLLFTTGPKEFNDDIRYNIKGIGYSWTNPRYFKNLETDEKISFDCEKTAMNFLGLKWIKPSKRKG
jgi:DNA polymerase/3'-5' exonuclease PolX